jgi:alkaline phosphatase D
MMVYSDDASELKRIDDDLKKVKNHFKVYQRKHLPPQYHLAGTARAGDLVLIPEAPYALATNRQHVSADVGAHGYDPDTTQTMRAIFFASGPQIKKHFHLKPFRNVHIYPFLAKLLGLKVTAPVDGDVKVLSPALH